MSELVLQINLKPAAFRGKPPQSSHVISHTQHSSSWWTHSTNTHGGLMKDIKETRSVSLYDPLPHLSAELVTHLVEAAGVSQEL